MGLQQDYLQFIESSLARCGLAGGRMCELGNQQLRGSTGLRGTGKEYFTPRFEHVSIDLNGRDGALAIDLSLPITDPALVGTFDVLTNSGTSEHVADQYECFANIHRLVIYGGLMVHISPIGSNWPSHDRTYATEFFNRLFSWAGYDPVDRQFFRFPSGRTVVAAAALKTAEAFLTPGDFHALAHDLR